MTTTQGARDGWSSIQVDTTKARMAGMQAHFVIRMSFPNLMERYPRGKEAMKPDMMMRAAASPASESE